MEIYCDLCGALMKTGWGCGMYSTKYECTKCRNSYDGATTTMARVHLRLRNGKRRHLHLLLEKAVAESERAKILEGLLDIRNEEKQEQRDALAKLDGFYGF